jgi:hypothetical protein
MTELDFYEVTQVLDTPTTRELGVPNTIGIVLGKAKAGEVVSYAVLIGDETYSLHHADLRPTGQRVDREEIYGGEHIRISPDGKILAADPQADDPE